MRSETGLIEEYLLNVLHYDSDKLPATLVQLATEALESDDIQLLRAAREAIAVWGGDDWRSDRILIDYEQVSRHLEQSKDQPKDKALAQMIEVLNAISDRIDVDRLSIIFKRTPKGTEYLGITNVNMDESRETLLKATHPDIRKEVN